MEAVLLLPCVGMGNEVLAFQSRSVQKMKSSRGEKERQEMLNSRKETTGVKDQTNQRSGRQMICNLELK